MTSVFNIISKFLLRIVGTYLLTLSYFMRPDVTNCNNFMKLHFEAAQESSLKGAKTWTERICIAPGASLSGPALLCPASCHVLSCPVISVLPNLALAFPINAGQRLSEGRRLHQPSCSSHQCEVASAGNISTTGRMWITMTLWCYE